MLVSSLAALLLLASPPAHAEVPVVVIVSVANPVTKLDREALSKLYLRKELRWADGTEAMILQPASRAAQEAFAKQVHQKSWKEVQHHYQQLVFSSRGSAPTEKKDDASVAAAVAKFPNAIGYVTAVPTDPGVKVVEVAAER